jgi:hypothetical protein
LGRNRRQTNSMWKDPMTILATLRQLRYPKEFRISPSVWPVDLIDAFERLAQVLGRNGKMTPYQAKQESEEQRMRFLADIGTGLWRLRQKMVKSGTDQPLEEMRRAYRHLESTWDALIQGGIEIQDHTGERFDSGMSLQAIAFQPVAGFGYEKVIETIKPTVYYKGRVIQMGEVIVGTPEGHAEMQNSQGTKTQRAEK